MKNNINLSVVYFSPTNGTKKAVTILADKIKKDYKTIDLTNSEERKNIVGFSQNDLVIVASPVYAGKIPQVQGLFENINGKNTPCIIMAAYGNRHYDNTLAQMKNILEKRGFVCFGAISVIIPHIYSKKLGTNRPDNTDIVNISKFADKIIDKLNAHNINSIHVPGEKEPKEYPINPGGKNIKNLNKELCNQCNICVDNCPVNAINKKTFEINIDLCINCMKCSIECPTNARTFDASETKKRLEENYIRRMEVESFV